MRSKEVSKAINQLIVDINFSETGCSTGIIEVKNIDTALNYISDLEKENMGLLTRLRADSLIDRDNYWRDKIIEVIEIIGKYYNMADEEVKENKKQGYFDGVNIGRRTAHNLDKYLLEKLLGE